MYLGTRLKQPRAGLDWTGMMGLVTLLVPLYLAFQRPITRARRKERNKIIAGCRKKKGRPRGCGHVPLSTPKWKAAAAARRTQCAFPVLHRQVRDPAVPAFHQQRAFLPSLPICCQTATTNTLRIPSSTEYENGQSISPPPIHVMFLAVCSVCTSISTYLHQHPAAAAHSVSILPSPKG